MSEPNDVAMARRFMREAFVKDGPEPGGFYDGYVSNVAMLLHDMQPENGRLDFTDYDTRNEAAKRILDLVFGKVEFDGEKQ